MKAPKRERTKLETKIYNDIQSEIWKYYNSKGVEYKDKEEPEDTIINFFSYLYRSIPKIKRNVHYSNELLKKINLNELSKEHIEILKKFEKAFEIGENMNGFLSNNTKNSHERDFLLYTWHLFHLHLSDKFVEDANQMKNNRSDTQLLCIIESSDVYFIDVIPHPTKAEQYFNISHLETIVSNGWIEKIGFVEMKDIIPGSLEPKIKKDEDFFKLYSKCRVNMAFEFQEKAYMPIEPMSATRHPADAVNKLMELNRTISKFNSKKGMCTGFKLFFDSNNICHGYVAFRAYYDKKIKYIPIF